MKELNIHITLNGQGEDDGIIIKKENKMSKEILLEILEINAGKKIDN